MKISGNARKISLKNFRKNPLQNSYSGPNRHQNSLLQTHRYSSEFHPPFPSPLLKDLIFPAPIRALYSPGLPLFGIDPTPGLQIWVHFYTEFPESLNYGDSRQTEYFAWRCKMLLYAFGRQISCRIDPG
jgi:hypothetical protein